MTLLQQVRLYLIPEKRRERQLLQFYRRQRNFHRLIMLPFTLRRLWRRVTALFPQPSSAASAAANPVPMALSPAARQPKRQTERKTQTARPQTAPPLAPPILLLCLLLPLQAFLWLVTWLFMWTAVQLVSLLLLAVYLSLGRPKFSSGPPASSPGFWTGLKNGTSCGGWIKAVCRKVSKRKSPAILNGAKGPKKTLQTLWQNVPPLN